MKAEDAAHRRLAGRWDLELGDDGLPMMLEALPMLRERRVAAGLSMKALEQRAGVAGGTVSPLEGRRGFAVSLDRARKIAAVLSADVDELFTSKRTQRSRRGGRRVPATPPKKRAQPGYMRAELAAIEADANARGLLTIDQVREAFRRAAALSAETRRRRWRPDRPYVLPTYTRQAVNYYVSRGDLTPAEWVTLSTGRKMRLFRAQDVEELARSRFSFPNGNVREWEQPSDAVRAGPAELLSGRARQKVKGRWGGAKPPSAGARPRGREKVSATPAQMKEIRGLAKRGWGRRAIANRLLLSERLVRNVLEAA